MDNLSSQTFNFEIYSHSLREYMIFSEYLRFVYILTNQKAVVNVLEKKIQKTKFEDLHHVLKKSHLYRMQGTT